MRTCSGSQQFAKHVQETVKLDSSGVPFRCPQEIEKTSENIPKSDTSFFAMLLNHLIEVFSLVVSVETFENMTLLHKTVQNGEEGKRLSYSIRTIQQFLF